MPVYPPKNIDTHIKLGVWNMVETIENLIQLAVEKNIALTDIPKVKNENRIKQWLATRLLLTDFFEDAIILYDDFGKPYLDNGWNISISHSSYFVAIIINEKSPCGIDIEKISPKVGRIKHKFLNHSDLRQITTDEELTIYWSAKEALYKYYGKKEVLFIEHLFIEEYSKNKKTFNGIIDIPGLKTKIKMSWEKIEDYVLIYTL